jgi:hypothetical protein
MECGLCPREANVLSNNRLDPAGEAPAGQPERSADRGLHEMR